MGRHAFLQPLPICNRWMVFPRAVSVRSCCGAKLSKTCQSQEDTHWAHPRSLRNHLLTLRAPAVGEGFTNRPGEATVGEVNVSFAHRIVPPIVLDAWRNRRRR